MKFSKQMCLFKILIGLVYIDAALRCARTKYDQLNDSTGEANLCRPGVKSSPFRVTTKKEKISYNNVEELWTEHPS